MKDINNLAVRYSSNLIGGINHPVTVATYTDDAGVPTSSRISGYLLTPDETRREIMNRREKCGR